MARPKGSGVTAPEIRFWRKVQPAPADQCWIWQGAATRLGYGRFFIRDGVWIGAHRFAYEHLRDDIPDGLSLDHLCRNPRCVNPWHLEPVTHRVNVQRGAAVITHCPAGHPYPTDRPSSGCKRCDADRHYTSRGIGSARWKYPDFQVATRPTGPVMSLDLTT